jgi:hypothetical protein
MRHAPDLRRRHPGLRQGGGCRAEPGHPRPVPPRGPVLDHLGGHELWARLLASYDDGAWVALLIEDVDGRHPDFGDAAEVDAVLRAVDRLGLVLQERDVPSTVDLVDVAHVFGKWADSLATLADASAATPVPAWLRTDPYDYAAVLREHAGRPMRQVVHWDIRVDNLLRRPGGEVVVGDWGVAARGPAWVDPLLARLECVEDPWFDTSAALSPALAEVGDDAVTAFLAGFAAHLAVRSVVAIDVNLPTLNDFRVRESRRMLEAVARRTGR